MIQEELQTIERLTGVAPNHIKLADDEFWSRGYIIDNGRIVFKFKKAPEVSYQTEIKALDFVNSLNLGINLQKVGWVAPDDSYLGLHGVVGKSLDSLKQPNYQLVGKQLASALKILHQAHPADAETLTQPAEITAWQERYKKSYDKLSVYFSSNEITRLNQFFLDTAPRKLRELGENLVFSHGDLGDGNILVDDEGRVGVIDFSEMYYLDEAADFMDVGSDVLREEMLNVYGANDKLREKVRIRVLLRPLFVLGDYIKRGDTVHVKLLIKRIRKLLEENYDTI